MNGIRKIRKKYLLSFKWIWYWLTKESIKNRKLRREGSKKLMDSMNKRLQKNLLHEHFNRFSR